MTIKQVNQAALLTSLPSFLVIVVALPGLWFANKAYVPDWAGFFAMMGFLISIPFAFVGGTLGLIVSFQRRLVWPVRCIIVVVNLGALLYTVYVVSEIIAGLTFLSGLRH